MPAKKSRSQFRPRPSPARQLHEKLDQAGDLAARKRYAEAINLLESLLRRHPAHDDILTELVNVSLDAGDQERYLQYIAQLSKLRRDDPDIMLGLAGSYLQNTYPVMATRVFREFVSRWPDHPRAADARATLASLEQRLANMLTEAGLPPDEDIGALHEEARARMSWGDYAGAQQAGRELLKRHPGFVPALNNISMAQMAEGNLTQAINTAQQALHLDPENYHALSNLVRFMCMTGRMDEAKRYADRLRTTTRDVYDAWLRKLEAFSFLGDDEAVAQTFAEAGRSRSFGEQLGHKPLVFHLAAAAICRRGDEKTARALWNKALRISPGLAMARENLDDLRNPPGKRHGPWAFTMQYWISAQMAADINAILSPAARGRHSEKALSRAGQRLVQKHPELNVIVPVLLERGDPAGCQLAMRLAAIIRTPEMLSALRTFMLGQRGSDALRLEASRLLSEAGAAPTGTVRMWLKGEWQDIVSMGFSISTEPAVSVPHSREVAQMLVDAVHATHNGQFDRAEELLKQALQIEPESPDLLNNLAAVYSMTNRGEETRKMVFDLHRRFPDYLFGITNAAQLLARDGRPEEAERMLNPLLERKEFHVNEFSALCQAQIEMWLAKGKPEGARTWLEMWEQVDPDHRMLKAQRERLERMTIWQKIARKVRKTDRGDL